MDPHATETVDRSLAVPMLTIDGRQGGGQLLRTALTLSAMWETPFRMDHIRAGRPETGLKSQHLAAVRAVAVLCRAEVTGATVGTETLTFQPRSLRPASTAVDIGSAGSVSLLFDTALPFATVVRSPFELMASGGTDVQWSPPIGYLGCVKLPLLARFGLNSSVDVIRTGFYPAGGGRATLRIEPSTLQPIRLTDRGSLDRLEIVSKASAGLAQQRVAERQASHAKTTLRAEGYPADTLSVDYVDAASPGSLLLIRGIYDRSRAGFSALGERGKPAETVADDAVTGFLDFHRVDAAVDEHMADQLLVILALAGGRMSVPAVTPHIESNLDVIARFGRDLSLSRRSDGTALVDG